MHKNFLEETIALKRILGNHYYTGRIGNNSFIGKITDVITFKPPEIHKNSTGNITDQCFQKLKNNISKEELMSIISKKLE